MNNLLRTLTENNVKPHADLRLLLNTVKEGRKQCVDNKLSDPFYDALDGVLADLKTVTLDNRDADAFLKPVSKAEVPDYYDVISNPMDFQTMQKKVKLKNYKSKREFKDDLELIWSNCYTYNASENHPLRLCVKRLKAKADRLLKHVTDRRERTDPYIPLELGAGYFPKMNGTSRTHTRSPSYSSIKASTPGLAGVKSSSSTTLSRHTSSPLLFEESLAIVRTPEGMSTFYELDKDVVMALKKPNQQVLQKLRDLVSLDTDGSEDTDMEDVVAEQDGAVGDKRKLSASNGSRPRKRARFMNPYPAPLPEDEMREELSELWWAAAQSDTLLANGVPPIPFGPASSEQKRSRLPSLPSSSSSSSSSFFPFHSSSCPSIWQPTSPPLISKAKPPKPKRRKKSLIQEPDEIPPTHIENSKALLNMMNTNIKAMRRIRHTHSKFAALNATTLTNEDTEEGGGGGGGSGGTSGMPGVGLSGASGFGSNDSLGGAGENSMMASADDEILNEKVDERPWVMMMQSKGKKSKGKEKIARVGGVEIGQKNSWGCMQWTNTKILEHVGFQGASQVALDVMAGVMAEYISNVGRTIKYLCDQRPTTMTPEEIVLHTLFESGTSKVQDLERYIRDDVERYSSRLSELEKKIVGAYRDTTAVETLEDEGLFEEEEEEETGALAIGDFADLLGEDYLGLRELGIAQEYGMSNLSVPKKLLRSKKNQHKPATAKPSEPPPPYPPPPPFIPLASSKLDDQIGLLKSFYQNRFTTLAASVAPPPPPPPLPGPVLPGLALGALPGPIPAVPPLPGPSLPGPSIPQVPVAASAAASTSAPISGLPSSNSIMVPGSSTVASSSDVSQLQQSIDLTSLPPLTLVDDSPTAVQVKMGPLGQIVKGGGTGGGGKKKSKGSGGGGSGGGSGASGAGNNPGTASGATASSGSAVPGTGGSGAITTSPAIPSMTMTPTTSVDGNASPKKKKSGGAGTPSVGTGNGRKKKGPEGSQQNGTTGGNGQGGGGGGSSQPYPPVVVASA